MPEFLKPRPLTAADHVAAFDCGEEALNKYLARFAMQAQQGDGARTYVSLATDDTIVGYYTLAFGSVEPGFATTRMRKGQPRHAIPIMVLARLAVTQEHQGHGLGAGLLRDALLRTIQAADIAGLRALVVDAKGERAKSFYLRYGFESFPGEPLRLALLLKDIRAQIGG